MDIIEQLREAVTEHGSKVKASEAIGIRRQTLDHWLGGLYHPDPWEHSERIADFLAAHGVKIDEAEVALRLLERKGVSTELLRRMGQRATRLYPAANRAKGLSRHSAFGTTSQPMPQLVAA